MSPSNRRSGRLLSLLAAAIVGGGIFAGIWAGFTKSREARRLAEKAEQALHEAVRAPSEAPREIAAKQSRTQEARGRAVRLQWQPPSIGGKPARPVELVFSAVLAESVPDFDKRLERVVSSAQADAFGDARAEIEALKNALAPESVPELDRLERFLLLTWGASLLEDGRNAQAVLVLGDLDALSPDDKSYEPFLGLAFYRAGDLEKAYDYLNRAAARLGPDSSFAFELGELSYYRNEFETAEPYLRIALSGPRAAEAKRLLGRIDKESSVEGKFREIVGNEEGHFRILFDGTQNAQAAYGTRVILEQARRDVGRRLDFYPSDRITAILYTRIQYSSALNAPDWSGALYDGKIRLPTGGLGSSALKLKDTIYHEYVHAVVHRLGGDDVPAWVHEGLAQMLEPDARAYRYQTYDAGRYGLISLFQLERSFAALSGPAVGQAYAQSQSFVGYLLAEHGGARKLRQLLETLAAGRRAPDAVRQVYGLEQEALERRWRETLSKGGR